MSDHLKRQTPLSKDETACAMIRKAWLEEGRSAGEIAELISKSFKGYAVTRNVIIGIVARKGWKRSEAASHEAMRGAHRATPKAAKPRPEPVAKVTALAAAPTPPRPAPVRAAVRDLPDPKLRTGPTLLELTPGQCRSPVGPLIQPFGAQMFCAERVQTRDVEVRKGQFDAKVDSYCANCAKRNRIGLVSSLSARQRQERSMRAFA